MWTDGAPKPRDERRSIPIRRAEPVDEAAYEEAVRDAEAARRQVAAVHRRMRGEVEG
jgi:hypothetical protein